MSVITPAEFREALNDWLGDRVKFHPDWPHATTAGGFDAHGIVHHWDAIPKRYRLETHLRVLRYGNAGLPGPLCHCSPARNGDLWVIGWGNCNHAGTGDSSVYRKVLEGRFDGSPAATREDVDGNAVFYGFEYQFHPDDGPMPDEQYEAGVLAAAAISQAHGWSPDGAAGSNLDHFEWAARKWDREIDNLANRTRRDIKAALLGDFTGGTPDMNIWNIELPLPGKDADGNRRTMAAKWVLTQAWNRAGGARAAARENSRALADLADLVANSEGFTDAQVSEAAQKIADRVNAQIATIDAEELAERLDITYQE